MVILSICPNLRSKWRRWLVTNPRSRCVTLDQSVSASRLLRRRPWHDEDIEEKFGGHRNAHGVLTHFLWDSRRCIRLFRRYRPSPSGALNALIRLLSICVRRSIFACRTRRCEDQIGDTPLRELQESRLWRRLHNSPEQKSDLPIEEKPARCHRLSLAMRLTPFCQNHSTHYWL